LSVKLLSGGVVYSYSATNRRARAASWSIFAPPRTGWLTCTPIAWGSALAMEPCVKEPS